MKRLKFVLKQKINQSNLVHRTNEGLTIELLFVVCDCQILTYCRCKFRSCKTFAPGVRTSASGKIPTSFPALLAFFILSNLNVRREEALGSRMVRSLLLTAQKSFIKSVLLNCALVVTPHFIYLYTTLIYLFIYYSSKHYQQYYHRQNYKVLSSKDLLVALTIPSPSKIPIFSLCDNHQ